MIDLLKLEEFNKKYNLNLSLEDYQRAQAEVQSIAAKELSSEGALAMAQVLGDLISPEPSYKGIARKVLQVKTVSGSEVNKYWKKEKDVTSYIMANGGQIRKVTRKFTSYTIDIWPITSENVTVTVMDLILSGLDIIADTKQEISESMDKIEDQYLLSLLASAASGASHTSQSNAANFYGLVDFITQWKALNDHIDKPATLIMHPNRLMDLLTWGDSVTNGVFTPEIRQGMLKTGTIGNQLFVNTYTTTLCSPLKVYMVGAPEELGWFLQVPQEGNRRRPVVTFGMDEMTKSPAYSLAGFEVIGMAIAKGEAVHEITIKTS